MTQPDTTAPADVPALAGAALPPDRNPAAVYLASLTEGPGRVSMRSTLAQIAGLLGFSIEDCPWQAIRIEHVTELRSTLADEGYAPATANKYLSALRGIARQAWRLGELPFEEYHRIAAVRNVVHDRRPRGRTLDADELRALFDACNDGTPAGARDAAAFAMLFGCGMRRAAAAAADLADYDPESGTLRRIGKGIRERMAHVPDGTKRAIADWLAVRGTVPGPLLAPVAKGGAVQAGSGMSPHALRTRLKHRTQQAGIADCTPDDLRRTFHAAQAVHVPYSGPAPGS